MMLELPALSGVKQTNRVWTNGQPGAISHTQPVSNASTYGHLGHTKDADLGGLIYMRARYYEPWTARLISEDPAQSGTNWFIYATCNPVSNVDPDGKVFWGVLGLAAFFVSFVIAEIMRRSKDYYDYAIYVRVAGGIIGAAGMAKAGYDAFTRAKGHLEQRKREVEEQLTAWSQSTGQGSVFVRIAAGLAWRYYYLYVWEAE